MIRVHHLNYSRSTRILWLLEELGQPYEIVPYARDPQTLRAPAALEKIHPLGKAPVIEDGTTIIAESGAIIEYLVATYDDGKLGPRPGTPGWAAYIEWLHYAEGSAMAPLLVLLIGKLTGGAPSAMDGFFTPEAKKALDYIAAGVKDGYLLGDKFSAADVQMFYVVEAANMIEMLGAYPALQAYMKRLSERLAYQRAIERGGPVALPVFGKS